MSVGKHVFSKRAHRLFLRLFMKLGCLKSKKLTEPDFKIMLKIMLYHYVKNSGKNLVLEFNAKMLSANQIARFLNFNISKTIEV